MFDKKEAKKAIDFIETHCRHVKGEWAGQLISLEKWQKDFIGELFGEKNPDGTRKYRRAALWVAKKNSKTTMSAAIALKLLAADGEKGAEVYSVACDKEQAKISFDIASGMVRQDGVLSTSCEVYQRSIVYKGGSFRALSRESTTKHGFNTSGLIVDEWAFHRDGELVDALTTGMAAREQPLTIYISTANFRKSDQPGWKFYNHCKKVQQGLVEDKSLLVRIFEAAEEDDPFLEETWKKANPNYKVSVKRAYMEDEVSKAKISTIELNKFKRFHLNIWTGSEVDFIPLKEWRACNLGKVQEKDFLGMECYGGLDLASSGDFCSLALLFRRENTYHCLVYFWIPKDTMDDRKNAEQIRAWCDDKWIIATPGKATDYTFIRDKILSLYEKFDIKEIAYDPYNARQLCIEINDKYGINMLEFRQGWRTMSPATKEFQRMVRDGSFNHGGNPVLDWQISNVVLKIDDAENIIPHKGKSDDKIDGVVSAIMATARAIFGEKEPPSEDSIYETMSI